MSSGHQRSEENVQERVLASEHST